MKQKVAVGMSGGVDSSYAAIRLKEMGYDVCGVMMSIWDSSLGLTHDAGNSCFGPGEGQSIESARRVADEIGIPFYLMDLKKEFQAGVISYIKDTYKAGFTPNPCVMCNRFIKFGALIEQSMSDPVNADFFATGHYAQVVTFPETGRKVLKRASDRKKDQTYFLSFLSQSQLGKIIFPLSSMTKDQVRKKALDAGIHVAKRPESQDFMGGHYGELFGKDDRRPGDIVDQDGKVLGKHTGIVNYTIGQRKGLVAAGYPIYVTHIDAERNRVVVGKKEALYGKGLISRDFSLMAYESLSGELRAEVRIRQNHRPAPAVVCMVDDALYIVFDEPQLSITPGQTAVIYRGDYVVGGAIIDTVLK